MFRAVVRGESFLERVSLAIAVAGGLAIAGVGASLYLADGSYFLDEAAVVESLDGQSLLETFSGPLEGGGQNFPRFYLAAIRGVRAVFGPQTLATRLLPHVFFLLATALWMRLLWCRFRGRPLVLLLGVALTGMSSSWWLYGAVVKQYSLDVFLVLALFSVPDRVFTATLRGGRRRSGIALLVVPILLSYTYGIALLARVLGWYAAGLRDRGFRLDAGALAVFVGGFAALSGVLWLTDLRHTLGQEGLFAVWQSCLLGGENASSATILERFFFGWYTGPTEFIRHPKLAVVPLAALHVALLVGLARVAGSLVRPADGTAWGSRSVACLAGVCGTIGSSFVLDYPICAGRLVLYAFFFQQVLLLEGLDQLVAWTARGGAQPGRAVRAVRAGALVAMLALVGASGVTALRVAGRVHTNAPLEDVRPLLPRLDDAPRRPLVATNCMRRQIATLPEGVGERDVVLFKVLGWRDLVPRGEEVWLLHSRLTPHFCEQLLRQASALTDGLEEVARGPARGRTQVVLYRTRFLEPHEVRAKRKRVLRQLDRAARSSP